MSADMKEQLARRETDFELQIRELNDSLARTKAQLEMAKANSASAPRSNAISNAFLRNPSAYTTVPTLLGNSAGKIDPLRTTVAPSILSDTPNSPWMFHRKDT